MLVALALGLGAVASAQDQATAFDTLDLELVAEGLVSPVTLTAPAGDDRLFVVDRPGQVLVFDQQGQMAAAPFLDIADRMVELSPEYDERGLLGFAFHPDFAENGRAFAYYSAPLREGAPEGWNHTAHLSSFTMLEDGSALDPASEVVLLEIDQPQMNHNGGQLLFGHDGYLYLGLGDGGAANDVADGHPPMGNGQDVTTLLGSVLRLDVNVGEGYGIPQDNPFAAGVELPEGFEWSGDAARPEIYLWGVRNPYRFSVDRETGALMIPDVGQNLWEEVNVVTAPGNLGWNLREGAFGFDPANPGAIMEEGVTTGPMGETLVEPVITYAHPNVADGVDVEERGISISGGYVYRGSAIPDLVGNYVFGDWSQSFTAPGGKLFVASPDDAGGWAIVLDRQLDEFVLAFGEDANGEIYVLTTEQAGPQGTTGKVYRLVDGE
jgi:glucose/arabinose dehydrogenase